MSAELSLKAFAVGRRHGRH